MRDVNGDPPIVVSGLEVRYGRSVAVAGVSLEVGLGRVYALLGRNGAGKSSLVRVGHPGARLRSPARHQRARP